MHAFGLTDDPTYRAIAMNFGGNIFAGRSFIGWLLEHRLKELDEPTPGCAVLYFSGKVWQHIGTSTSPGRVTSKWGTFPVYDHAILEVPERYGDSVRYFERPDREEAIRLFLQFARSRGLSADDIAWAIAQGSL